MESVLWGAVELSSDMASDIATVQPDTLGSLIIDCTVFFGFLIGVVAIGILMSRRKAGEEVNSESYFLAGRGLAWWLIGFSLIAANISTEQFVGMSGDAARYVGLAIASYEWVAAVTLVIVAFVFLPKFLRSGIYTIPEFLEQRYNKASRTLMSLSMLVILVGVTITAVIFSGAKTFSVYFGDTTAFGVPLNIETFTWLIGFVAVAYVASGGLKACAWADLLQGTALIAGGALVLYLALKALGKADPAVLTASADLQEKIANSSDWERFMTLNAQKLRMNLPAGDLKFPVTALLFGIWIPNLYYWGLNQYIMQRTLGSKSLGEGQKGIVFAAVLKLIVPFIVVFPGIIAFNLFSDNMREHAEGEDNNKPVYVVYQEVKETPETSKILFRFDKDFFELHPDTAKELVTFNAAVLQTPVPETESLLDANKTLLATMDKKNKEINADNRGKPQNERVASYTLEKELIGYDYDAAFPFLMRYLVPPGLRGFILAAILGAVISSLGAMLNAASTIFAMDIYKEYLHRKASQRSIVFVGRFCVVLFAVIGCLVAPTLNDPKFMGIFSYIQEFQGFFSPGILAAFVFGFLVRRAPGSCGVVALLLSPVSYTFMFLFMPQIPFLDRMAISFCITMTVMAFITCFFPREIPYRQEVRSTIDLKDSRAAKLIGILIILATIALYMYFWDYQTPMFSEDSLVMNIYNMFANIYYWFAGFGH